MTRQFSLNRVAILGGVLGAAMMALGALVETLTLPGPSDHVHFRAGQQTFVVAPLRAPHRTLPALVPESDVPRRRDLRGNEIVRPVARYKVDAHGTLYEVHSPQTELPKLRPPQS